MDYSLISYSCILVYLKKPGFEKTQGKNWFIWKNPGFIGFFQNFGFFAPNLFYMHLFTDQPTLDFQSFLIPPYIQEKHFPDRQNTRK